MRSAGYAVRTAWSGSKPCRAGRYRLTHESTGLVGQRTMPSGDVRGTRRPEVSRQWLRRRGEGPRLPDAPSGLGLPRCREPWACASPKKVAPPAEAEEADRTCMVRQTSVAPKGPWLVGNWSRRTVSTAAPKGTAMDLA